MASVSDIVNVQLQAFQTTNMNSLALVSQQLVARMQQEAPPDATVDLTRPDYVRAATQRNDLLNYKDKVADQLAATTKAKGAIGWVSAKLNTMLSSLQNIQGSNDPDARAQAASDFNDALDFLNDKVDGATQKIGYQDINLVGNPSLPDFKTDSLYVSTSTTGAHTMVNGAYMGSDYSITASDGTLWTYSSKDQAYIQRSNDASATATGDELPFDGTAVQSFDPDSNSVTLVNSTTGQTLSGTVTRGGIGVLGAAFYDNFQDDDAVQSAIDDVNKAIKYVASRGANINADASIMQSTDKGISEKLSTVNGDIDSILQEQLSEADAKNKAARLKISLAVNNINLVSQHNTSIVQNLVDAVAGPSPAVGVFGQLGY